LGPLAAPLDLFTVAPDNRDRALKRLCRTHVHPAHQQMWCDKNEPHQIEDEVKGRQNLDGEWQLVEEGERPSFEGVKKLDFVPTDRTEAERDLVLTGKMYYCAPGKDAPEDLWVLLTHLVTSKKHVLLAKGNFRKAATQPIWKLGLFRGYLVLQQVVFPSEVREAPPAPDIKLAKNLKDLGAQFLESANVAWDEFDATDEGQELFNEWLNSGSSVASEKPKARKPVADLQAQLQAALAGR